MKALPLVTFALTLLAASLPRTSPAQAGTSIQRCQSGDGTTIYTDRPCSMLGAAPLPLPGDLLTRIAREQAVAAPSPDPAGAVAPDTAAIGRRPPTAGCARTPTQLVMDLRGSLALGNVNRLAESYHWVGLSQPQSKPIMLQLERLGRQPLAGAQYFAAQIGPAGMMQWAGVGTGNANAATGVMQLMFGGTTRQALDLEVVRHAGCYFIRF